MSIVTIWRIHRSKMFVLFRVAALHLPLLIFAGGSLAAQTTRTIVAKSFIQKIDISDPSQCTGTFAKLFASLANCGFSENPETSNPNAGDFRIYSKVSATVTCDGDRVADWSLSPVEIKFGTEFKLFTGMGAVKDQVKTNPPMSGMSSQQKVSYTYAIKGRPPESAEHSFQAIKNRTCAYIWHRVEGEISCKLGSPIITANVIGSRFPSHRAWVDGERTSNVEQGSFMNLWECSQDDPTMVR